ncbi:MAG: hypothetical protein F6J87_17970 [Spirulina sp. SIO3F2]|nr:hypothetical protein [Spirulina sp. SIO3F2]
MNNMNDPLAWLYQELLQSLTQPPPVSTQQPRPNLPPEAFNPEAFSEEAELDWDALLWDVLDEQDEARGETAPMIGGESATPQPFAKGDRSAVYKRFEQIIRNRIRDEVHANLPRFPWEHGLAIDELDYVDDFAPRVNPLWQQAWLPQLQSLLPMQIPEQTLLQLLAACTQVVGSVQPHGIKMADAAKTLFPGYGTQLNEVINRIRLSPTLALDTVRDATTNAAARSRLAQVLPATYQSASLEQQMAIAVVLAKSILDGLTLNLTPRHLSQHCVWQSTAGEMSLQVTIDPHSPWGQRPHPIRIQATLPQAGQLTLTTPKRSLSTQCAGAGSLALQLADWQPGQTYLLTLEFQEDNKNNLQFALICQHWDKD